MALRHQTLALYIESKWSQVWDVTGLGDVFEVRLSWVCGVLAGQNARGLKWPLDTKLWLYT